MRSQILVGAVREDRMHNDRLIERMDGVETVWLCDRLVWRHAWRWIKPVSLGNKTMKCLYDYDPNTQYPCSSIKKGIKKEECPNWREFNKCRRTKKRRGEDR